MVVILTRLFKGVIPVSYTHLDVYKRQAVDWALLRGIVAHLDALLTENDMQANEVFRDAAPMLRAGLGPQTGVIERQINAFEYKRALTLLRAAVAGQSELHGVQPDYPLT